MMKNEHRSPTIVIENETLSVIGNLTFDSVVNIWKLGSKVIQKVKGDKITVNLVGLLPSDSSSLALWSSWTRLALRQNKTLTFINVPAFMQDLIRVHELETLLPMNS